MSEIFSLAAVYRGYRACRRRKRGTANAQRYERQLLDHLIETRDALQARAYAPARSLCFVARQPKAREIHAADFRDRVVHHLLVARLEPLFEPIFLHDLYSNRVGKGTHAAVARLAAYMRAVSDNGHRPAWFLQLDIHNFFNRIDQAILFRLVTRRLGKAVRRGTLTSAEAHDLAWLTRVLLRQDFRRETLFRATPRELARVPEHKRLTAAPPGKGLPIGNLTSQFFANVYLNELDQFVKHRLQCRYYLRYVDDFVLLDPDPDRLRAWEGEIAAFLAEHLALSLKPERVRRPVTDGANFLGYLVRPHYRLVRRRVIGNLRAKLDAFFQEPKAPRASAREGENPGGGRNPAAGSALRLPPEPRDRLRAQLASYLGHFSHAQTGGLVHALFRRYPWLGWLFTVRQGRLRVRWEPPGVTSLRSQVVYFRRAFAPALIVLQLGNRVALFEPDLALALADAPWMARWRATRTEDRKGLGAGLSWPLSHLRGIGRSLRRADRPYAFVAEEGHLPGGMKRRVLRYLFLGAAPATRPPLFPWSLNED